MKIKKIVFVVLPVICILFSSCKNNNIKDLENILSISLNDKITFIDRVEKWDNFHGDGYFMEVYNIKQNYIDVFEELIKTEKFIPLENKTGSYLESSDIKESIKQQKGYYKTIEKSGEVRIIVYNNIKEQLIYYCILY